jgi:hypothetical protein
MFVIASISFDIEVSKEALAENVGSIESSTCNELFCVSLARKTDFVGEGLDVGSSDFADTGEDDGLEVSDGRIVKFEKTDLKDP